MINSKSIALFLFLFGFWLLMSGHYTVLITSLGVFSCLLCVYLTIKGNFLDLKSSQIKINALDIANYGHNETIMAQTLLRICCGNSTSRMKKYEELFVQFVKKVYQKKKRK